MKCPFRVLSYILYDRSCLLSSSSNKAHHQSIKLMTPRRRIAFIRYNPFTSIPFSSLLLVGAIGVVSGVYIFDDLVKNASLEVIEKRKREQQETLA